MEAAAHNAECDGDADDNRRCDSHIGMYPITPQRCSRDAPACKLASQSNVGLANVGLVLLQWNRSAKS
jgi:hypothetical protein